ncbi:unnamed protein product [Meganyctiphanes norvegica]|uniref:Retrovirus-related Pol polyprotein from transposon TNT 1-94-like beta-barrel domain-containing protein n=1 Tax=Meganyctiphanes norvegica TaxID=48144 RepID=A0AAV2Q8Z1_MEGNR
MKAIVGPAEVGYRTAREDLQARMQCFLCKRVGHKARWCKFVTRWCEKCKSASHHTDMCWHKDKDTAKIAIEHNEDVGCGSYDFAMNVVHNSEVREPGCKHQSEQQGEPQDLLVDSGRTEHLISDITSFTNYRKEESPTSHTLVLADQTEIRGAVEGRGDALFKVCDSKGVSHTIKLRNALHVPTYKHNIFSVSKATENGVSFAFSGDVSGMIMPNGTVLDLVEHQRLYFLPTRTRIVRHQVSKCAQRSMDPGRPSSSVRSSMAPGRKKFGAQEIAQQVYCHRKYARDRNFL